jgi:hypothetical protein
MDVVVKRKGFGTEMNRTNRVLKVDNVMYTAFIYRVLTAGAFVPVLHQAP